MCGDDSGQLAMRFRHNPSLFAKNQGMLWISLIQGVFLRLLANEHKCCTVWGSRVYLCASRLFSISLIGN